MRILRLLVAVCVLALAFAPPAAAATTETPVEGTVTGQHGPPDFTAPGCPEGSEWRYSSEGSGELSPFGSVDYSLTQCTRADPESGQVVSSGTTTFTFATGDTLVIAQEMLSQMIGADPPTGFTNEATWTVVEGTGRFAQATGSGSLEGAGDIPDGTATLGLPDGLWKLTFKGTVTTEQMVTGLVLVDAKTDQDVGPLRDGTVIDLGSTPMFNIRVETVPGTVGSVGFAVTDADGTPVHFRLDGQPRENFPPYAVGGDWPVGDYLPMTLGPGSYTLKVTPYSGGSLTGTTGPAFTVTFTVAEPLTATYSGEIIAVTVDPALVAARCDGPAWGFVTFEGSGTSDLLGPLTVLAENCSYAGPLPDGTIGPNGTYGEGTLLITTDNGDVINGTYTDGTTLVPPPITEFADSWTITGGTGKFAAATGSGTEWGTADLTMGPVPGAAFTVTVEGVISY
jgi:hypothetical protein